MTGKEGSASNLKAPDACSRNQRGPWGTGTGPWGPKSEFQRHGLLVAGLCLVCLFVLVSSGCGRYKEQLESAKQQIEKLNSESQRLNEALNNLQKERDRLSGELKDLSEKDAALVKDLALLQKEKTALSGENDDLKKRNAAMQGELATLKKDRSDLSKEVDELNKRLSEWQRPGKETRPDLTETTRLPGPKEEIGKPAKGLSPCDAVIEFMKTSEKIVRQFKGEERKKMLQEVERNYADRIGKAPEKALREAKSWVSEMDSSWDKPGGDTVYNLIVKRNSVLEACKKKPEEAGF